MMELDKYTSWLEYDRSQGMLVLSGNDELPAGDRRYALIVCILCLESRENPKAFLHDIRGILAENGKLLLYCDNRLGLRYFSGELDPFTHNFGDGLDNYIHRHSSIGRCYTSDEIKQFISAAGFDYVSLFSVLPSVGNPKFIISSDYVPNEKMSIRFFPKYRNPGNLFLEEEYVVDALFANGLMPGMADGLLFEVSATPFENIYDEVIISYERKKELSTVNYILKNGKVRKKALYKEGVENLRRCKANEDALCTRGIEVVPRSLEMAGTSLVSVTDFQPYELANKYLQSLFFRDLEKFITEMDRFRDEILKASDIVNEEGHIQRTAYPDMVPLNCFVRDGQYVFFDQEFSVDDYPADSTITRAILIVYELDNKMETLLPKSFFFDRYNLSVRLKEWLDLAKEFTDRLYGEEHVSGSRILGDFNSNRFRMNYPERLFEKLAYNPVAGLENKSLYVMGENETAGKFIEMYRRDFDISAVLAEEDDCEDRSFMGYPVCPVSKISELDPSSYRAVICLEDKEYARKRLSSLGAVDIVFYNPEKVYPGRQACKLQLKDKERKKYHIGYVAGVFDLYHIGHLNMFRRAKELCDYLIVGVVTDEGVRDFKKTEPYIPFDQRIELVRSCCYVDEAVEIPYFNRGTKEAFEKYHFDVQFSGSDYADNALWLSHKKWLEERGSTMVFFSYTSGVSSTEIKRKISDKK